MTEQTFSARSHKPMEELSLHEMRLVDFALNFFYSNAEMGALEEVRTDILVLHEKFSAYFIPARERVERLNSAHAAIRGAGELKPARIILCATENCASPVNERGELCPACSGGDVA